MMPNKAEQPEEPPTYEKNNSLPMGLEKSASRIRIDLADGSSDRMVEPKLSGNALEDSTNVHDIARHSKVGRLHPSAFHVAMQS